MATNAPETRKTHVVRIVGTNRAGDRLDEIWLDLERMEIAKSTTQIPPDLQWVGVQRKLRWCDNPDGEDYFPDGTPSRLTEIVKVCDPQTQNVDDPDEWIPVRVIKGMKSKGGGGDGMGQGFMDRFVNAELQTARVVEVRKIPHYDTNIDAAAEAAFDADPSRKEYVVPGEFYEKLVGTKDEDQAVEHEIITYLKHSGNTAEVMGEGRQTKLLNEYLIDESEDPDGDVVGALGINPPYRLDPFQNIINVKFSSPPQAVVGMARSDVYRTIVSDDGLSYEGGFGAGTSNAASGLGRTVVASGRTLVAFGSPRDGDPCFIVVEGSTISRGVIDAGELVWTAVGSLPLGDGGEATSCSFANDGFFISYLPDDLAHSYLAVSFNGTSFTTGIDPFPGVVDVAQDAEETATGHEPDPLPVGGCVVYDKDAGRYVTAGGYSRTYWYQIDTVPPSRTFNTDNNFMSSVSTNGVDWSPHFDISEGSGSDHSINGATDIGGDTSSNRVGARVAFGNGVFVAASSFKSQQFDSEGPKLLTRTACGVARSIDGITWVNQRLPETEIGLNFAGDGLCVKYVKAKRPGRSAEGFFVLGGVQSETTGGPVDSQGMLWFSEDGASWSLVQTEDDFPLIISTVNRSRGTIVNI